MDCRVKPGNDARSDGFVIVAVLWILGALATLASIYAVYIVDTAAVMKTHDDRVQAESVVTAALELTAHQLTAQAMLQAGGNQANAQPGVAQPGGPQPAAAQPGGAQPAPQGSTRPSNGTFSFRLGNANVAVQFRSEAGRIDLNFASKELLAGLFRGFGARPEDAMNYAERIVAWRTKPQPGQDREASFYQAAGRRYVPRGAPFPHPGELWLVHGIPDVMIERAMPFVTVYSGRAQINVLDAAPEVLAALPGMTPDLLRTVLVQRAGTPQNGQILLPLLGPAQQEASTEPTKTVRVAVQIGFDNGRRLGTEAVIFVGDNDPEPYRVLSWQDGLEE